MYDFFVNFHDFCTLYYCTPFSASHSAPGLLLHEHQRDSRLREPTAAGRASLGIPLMPSRLLPAGEKQKGDLDGAIDELFAVWAGWLAG